MYMARLEGVNSDRWSRNNRNTPGALRHLQDFAASLCLLLARKGLLAQQFANETKGINFFLQAFQFCFFST